MVAVAIDGGQTEEGNRHTHTRKRLKSARSTSVFVCVWKRAKEESDGNSDSNLLEDKLKGRVDEIDREKRTGGATRRCRARRRKCIRTHDAKQRDWETNKQARGKKR